MIAILIVTVLFLLAAWGTARYVAVDGYGDLPGPRSHSHEFTAEWRA